VSGDRFEGTAVDIDSNGHLLVRTATGVQAVSAGEVEHLRQEPQTG
jgi:biotin-(acetyl-CoA carboxylase) ligase